MRRHGGRAGAETGEGRWEGPISERYADSPVDADYPLGLVADVRRHGLSQCRGAEGAARPQPKAHKHRAPGSAGGSPAVGDDTRERANAITPAECRAGSGRAARAPRARESSRRASNMREQYDC